tara:strand:+ start:631 stop:855 length:225 start_codon:yes stop_codon:yes gene_type:complete
MEFKKKITYSMSNGKIIITIKTFRNLHHFDNYYNKLIKSGCNVLNMVDATDIVGALNQIAIPDKDFYNRLIGKF